MTEENDNNEVEKPPIGIAPIIADDVFAEFQEEDEYDSAADDFDFVEHYDVEADVAHEEQLPNNTAVSALNCAFIGFGGGGGKLAKAFLDLGFNKTLLINTTLKDQPEDIDPKHIILIPDADGVAKNISFGKMIVK